MIKPLMSSLVIRISLQFEQSTNHRSCYSADANGWHAGWLQEENGSIRLRWWKVKPLLRIGDRLEEGQPIIRKTPMSSDVSVCLKDTVSSIMAARRRWEHSAQYRPRWYSYCVDRLEEGQLTISTTSMSSDGLVCLKGKPFQFWLIDGGCQKKMRAFGLIKTLLVEKKIRRRTKDCLEEGPPIIRRTPVSQRLSWETIELLSRLSLHRRPS